MVPRAVLASSETGRVRRLSNLGRHVGGSGQRDKWPRNGLVTPGVAGSVAKGQVRGDVSSVPGSSMEGHVSVIFLKLRTERYQVDV